MGLRADDGTPLPTKEPIVLDSDGNAVFVPNEHFNRGRRDSGFSPKIRTLKMSGWLAPLIVVGVVAILALGTVVMGAVCTLLLGMGLVRLLSQAFGSKVRR